MSESAHVRNLLKKGTKNQQPGVSKQHSYATLPRFGLKGAATQIIENLYDIFFDVFEDYTGNKFLVKYSMYADSDETTFYSNLENISDIVSATQGDFFESFPDLFISIYLSNDHIHGDPPPSPDAMYVHDPSNPEDIGEIELRIFLPSQPDDVFEHLRKHKLEICGTLVHEMQHVVQKHCYGEYLGGTVVETVDVHAFDKNEIDARVEEVISIMGEDTLEENKEAFQACLESYIDSYITRNVISSASVPDNIREIMIDSHIKVYCEKMEGIL